MDSEKNFNIFLTKVTSKNPTRITKAFRLDQDGKLIKIPGGAMTLGMCKKMSLSSARQIPELISSLQSDQALVYGVPQHSEAIIVTQKALQNTKRNGGPPIIARDREHFSWSPGAGILMNDYDPPVGQTPLSSVAFRELLYSVCPALMGAPHVLVSSASSHIYKGDECLKGASGQRLLVVVKNASDIPRAGQALSKRMWLKDHGYIWISKSGAMLERAPVDSAVWQPERLDFLAGAACEPPLEQRRPDPELFNPDAKPLDTQIAIPSLTLREEVEYGRLVKDAKEQAAPESQKIKRQWVEARVNTALKKEKPAQEEIEERAEQLRQTFTAAVEKQILLGEFVLHLSNDYEVTVGELLDNPDKYHSKKCADPLEPEYNNDKRIAYINLRAAGKPYIWSHAHGGRRYALHRARETLQIIAGERVQIVRRALELMKINGAHYQRGGEIVAVNTAGEVIPRDKDGILFDLDGIFKFMKYDGRSGELVSCDCRPNIAAGVKAAKGSWGLHELTGVATAPTMDPVTGHLIDADGYDPQTGIMLILQDASQWPGIPEEPNIHDVEKACKTFWKPFKDFPFDGPISRGVMLNALLTACVRPMLPTAPAVCFSAPVAGSGKTLIAKCLSELAGDTPAMLPEAGDQEESRKRILALLRENRRVIVWDNITGVLDSSALCALLTAENYSDRVLGVSETITVTTRSLFILTGNNIQLRGDLCRRVLTSRIDPETETPWKRCFDLDPVDFCRTHRLELIAAALTILRAGLQQGDRLPDRTASFEIWSDSIRRAVCFIGQQCPIIDVSDPVKSIDTAYAMDPETAKLSAFMAAWWDAYEDMPKTVGEVISLAEQKSVLNNSIVNEELYAAADEIAGERGRVNPRRLGRWIEKKRGRIIDGMCFELHGEKMRSNQWRLRKRIGADM